jgi:hypothetical protein
MRKRREPADLGKQYNEAANEDMARTIAHRFADEIISRLGAASTASPRPDLLRQFAYRNEIWEMDYDGQNQHQITHLGSVSLSPRISPDGSRIAFGSRIRRLVDTDVLDGSWPPGQLPGRVPPVDQIFLQPGRQTEAKLPSLRRDRGIPKSGWRHERWKSA